MPLRSIAWPLVSILLLRAVATADLPELRELSTDRPDTTESPRTVDAGHFQLEMEIGSFTRAGNEREFSLGELNAKMGLDARNDLQIVLPFYTQVRNGGEGFGDLQLRLKHNLWGNDEGDTALAIMPFIKIPSAAGGLGNGEFEGGIIVPFGFDGPAGWEFGVQAEIDISATDEGRHYPAFLTSVTASHAITPETGIFLEFVGILTAGAGGDPESYFNTGMTWNLTPAWQVDGGIRVGLTAASADFTPFFGLSTKF